MLRRNGPVVKSVESVQNSDRIMTIEFGFTFADSKNIPAFGKLLQKYCNCNTFDVQYCHLPATFQYFF